MKTALKLLAGVVLMLVLAFVALLVSTAGEQPLPALVTEDDSLPSADIAGVKLHLETVEGPLGSPTIIALHGGPGGDFRSLRALDALSDRYRVVYYDQRGAGLSERVPPEALTLDAHLAELRAVIAHAAGDGPVILLGHSWGAILATAYLGQYPDDVSQAVLIEPGFLDAAGRDTWQDQAGRFMSGPAYAWDGVLTGFRAQHVTAKDADAQDDFIIGHMVHRFASHPENPYHCGDGYAAASWRFGAEASKMLDRIPGSALDRVAEAAQEFDGPVLLMSGACDSWIGAELQARHAQLFTDPKLETIAQAGHDVLWDNPPAALAAIRSFLAAGE